MNYGYIERGHDLEGLIRQNEQLRVALKKTAKASKLLLQSCISSLSQIFPQIPSYQTYPSNLQEATEQFIAHLDGTVKVWINQQTHTMEHSLAKQRQTILNLEQKLQIYQSTINELSLIVQKLEQQAVQSKYKIDQFKLDLNKQRLRSENLEKAQLKWHSRYEVVKNELKEIYNDNLMIVNSSKYFDFDHQ